MALDKIIYWLFLLFMPALVFSSTAAEAIHLLILLLWIINIATTPGYRLERFPLYLPVALFLGIQLFSILFSVDPRMSLRGTSKLVPFTLFFIVPNNIRSSLHIRKMVDWLLISLVLATFYGLGKYVMGLEDRISSTSGGYSTMASLLYIGAILSVSSGMKEGGNRKRMLYYGAALLLLVGIVFTFHRIHGVLTPVALFALVMIKKPRFLIPFVCLLILMAFLAPQNVKDRFQTLISREGNWTSDRTILWKTAGELFPQSPWIGFGLKTFKKVFPDSARELCGDKGIGSWHNEYIQILMESGLPGLVSYLFFIGVLFWHGYSFFKLKTGDVMGYGILLSFLVYLMIGLTGTNYQDPIHSRLMFTFLASFFIIKGECTVNEGKRDR